ncbi:MAG: helix-turn-helix domain-containing protein [Candidatus Saccharimonadales bacterium]
MALGFFMKPLCLIQCIDDLGLSTAEAVVLDHLFSYWYDYSKTSNVYPATATIAKNLGLGNSTVGRHIRNLEVKGFIEREYRTGDTNIYHLMPTILMVREHVLRTHPPQKRGGGYSSFGRQPPPDLMTKEEPVIRRPNQSNLKKVGDLINERYKRYD